MARVCAGRCERYVGTQGGGMDQACSLLAQQGVGLHVQFDPVRLSSAP
jgi:N-acetylgalactosamine kinase